MITRYIKLRQDASYLILGPRQTGKTAFIQNRFPGAWYINLLLTSEFLKYSKDPAQFRREALLRFQSAQIQEGKIIVIIDEIQKIPALLDEVHSLIEEFPAARFVLTGSSARKLKRTSANLLAGRALSKRMYPFILPEITPWLEKTSLEELLKFGTLPGVFEKEPELKKEILRTYVETYLKEEIQLEGFTRSLPQFSHFLDVAAQSFTEVLNYSNVGRNCNQSPKTTLNYFEILEDTLIGHRLMSWSESKRKQIGRAHV